MKRLSLIIIICFLVFIGFPGRASAQITTFDPITAGIQSIIQKITAANTAIQAAYSKVEAELSALKYVRQGQELLNQIQQLQQESSSLISAVNNIQSTVMMPVSQIQGLTQSLDAEKSTLQNIINLENSNPQLSQYLTGFNSIYGTQGLLNDNTPNEAWSSVQTQNNNGLEQAAQTGAYAQSVLNNAPANQKLVSQLGANVSSINGTVSGLQANGQALVAIVDQLNKTNALLAEQAKLQATQAAQSSSAKAAAAQAMQNTTLPILPTPPPSGSGLFGSYPDVTNFGK